MSLDKCVQFWQTVLSGPLVALIQNAEHTMLRTVGCDCLATIGTQVFEQLPVNITHIHHYSTAR